MELIGMLLLLNLSSENAVYTQGMYMVITVSVGQLALFGTRTLVAPFTNMV